jgi:hypothetical protein
VLALSRAARSVTLYDAGNAVVHGFLQDYRARAQAATTGGALALDVHPFALLREGEAVYRDDDREKSLAFRLFRDGVRRLTFRPGVPWGELLALLEILAVRFSGVRQQEEDVVTLLRKAEFTGIEVAAVEGFVPEEDDPEPPEASRRSGGGARPPAGFDTPFPLLPPPGPLAFREIPEGALAPLRAEAGPDGAARDALSLAALLLAEAGRGVVAAAEVQQFLAEVRDFLIADRALPALGALAGLVERLPAGELRDAILRTLGDARVLEAVMASLPPGQEVLPAEAARLVPLVPAAATLDLLAAEGQAHRRAALLQIAESRLPAEAALVVERLPGLEPAVAEALLRAVGSRAPGHVVAASAALLEHREPGLQVAALRALEVAEGEVPVPRLLRLLQSPAVAVRVAAAELLGRRADVQAFQVVADSLTQGKDLSHEEAEAYGRALAQIHPVRASQLFADWLRPRRGLLRALSGGGRDELLRWAAVAGLGAHPAADSTSAIEAVAASADEALRRHCYATLARRRHQGARHG